jgi:hypothetical protein
LDVAEVHNVILAVEDHLVGDLHEKSSHSLGGVIVSGNGVDHLDGVEKGWEGLLDSNCVASVEGLKELLKSLKVLDIVFGFIKGLSDSVLHTIPIRGSKVDLVLLTTKLVRAWSSCNVENINDGSAVLASELLSNTGELAHSLFPVLELHHWASISLVVWLGIGFS